MFTPTARRNRVVAPKKHVERREERVPKVKSASICVDGADAMIACTVRDIHSSGARISIMSLEGIKESFMLIVRSENLVARAKVAWKKDGEIGVRFIRTGDLADEQQFHSEQQSAYAKEVELERRRIAEEEARAEQQRLAREHAEAQRIAQIRIAQMQIMGMDPTKPYSQEDLKSAFRKKAMTIHPDQGGDPVEFQRLNDVYNIMLNEFLVQVPQPGGTAA